MWKHVLIGSATTIALGVAASGCYPGDPIIGIGGPGGDTSLQTYKAQPISLANLDADGAAFSPNATNFVDMPGGSVASGSLTQLTSTNASPANNYFGVLDGGAVIGLASTPGNTAIESRPDHSPTRIDVIFTDSRTDNNSGARVLYARRYDAKDRSSTAPRATAGERFTPNGSVAATPPAEPIRLDRLQGGNVTTILGFDAAGSDVVLVWAQDGHAWAQYTSDGVTYRTTGGAPTPPLVDDNSSQNLVGFGLFRQEGPNGDMKGGLTLITKRDLSGGDVRAYMRGETRP